MVINDEFYMRLALDEALKYHLLTLPNPAVGALILDKNAKILSLEAHRQSGQNHAEVEAIISALDVAGRISRAELPADKNALHEFLRQKSGDFFTGASLYVTLEPCNHQGKTPPCASLIKDLGFARVVFGSSDATNGGAADLGWRLSITSGVLKNQTDLLLEPFRRYHEKHFVLFKFAQRLSGTYDYGKISCEQSMRFTHQIRNVCDLIVVGGNTVRLDKPTLDARLVGGRAPDVLIFSHRKDFDTNIPLFKIPNRRVFIEPSLARLDEYRYVLIEGAQTLYTAARAHIDRVLIFQTSSSGGKKNFTDLHLDYEFAHQCGPDLKIIAKSL
ncbi:MAG: bifunctional diaminohydroxyphosphoribosylaminopyrimidine deaminase/5-amino-6-(5-phosphoribosylamino)uracil reductase RibD [Helicobacteraceae bacterium]